MPLSEIRSCLEALQGKTLTTLAHRKQFDVVDVSRNWVIVKPHAGSGERRIKRERVEQIAALTVSEERLRQEIAEQYPSTRNSSYIAAIVAAISR